VALVGVMSARADGATTVAVGLAAVLSARGKTLLIDLNFDNPEVAPLLDVDPEWGLFDLAHNAKLAPVSDSDLEQRLGRRDGLAVLPGISRDEDVERVTDHFLVGLFEAATRRFDHVVMDLGRIRNGPRPPLAKGVLLWVASPTPLGMDALERRYWRVEEHGHLWLRRTRLVINRHTDAALTGVEQYSLRQYDLSTAGVIPDGPDYWRRVQLTHSVSALNTPGTDDPRYERHYGSEALPARRALEELAQQIVPIGAENVEAARV
jgi:hypothetical protein